MADKPFSWSIAKPADLDPLVANKPLREAAFDVAVETAGVEAPFTIPGVDKLTVTIKAHESTKVRSFFKKDGAKDDDHVIAEKPKDKSDLETTAPLLLDQKSAWIKYGLTVNATGAVKAELPFVGASGSGGVELHLADYHRHDPGEKARDAALSDVTHLRAPFVFAHAKSLKPQEALSLRASANLGAKVKINWSDVFTLALPALASALSLTSSFGLSIKADAFVSANLDFKDDFIFIISREKEGTFLVSVRKAPSTTFGGGVGLALGVGLDDDSVKVAVDAVIHLIDGLPDAEKGAALTAIGASTLDDAAKKTIGDKLKKIASNKIGVSFGAEYAGMHDYAALLELRLTEGELEEHFGDVLRGKLTKLSEELPKQVVRGFYREKIQRPRAWGFSLSFGDWKLAGLDKIVPSVSYQFQSLDRKGPHKVAYDLARTYDSKIGEAVPLQMCLTLKAASTELKAKPTAADLSYGLHLLLLRRGKLSGGEAALLEDKALIWEIMKEGDKRVREALDGLKGKDVEARLEMKIDDAALRKLLEQWNPDHPDLLATALARAMPLISGRHGPTWRVKVYQKLWRAYLLEKGDWSVNTLKASAKKAIPASEDGLRDFEGTDAPMSFADLAMMSTQQGSTPRPAALWEHWNLPSDATVSGDSGLNVGMRDLLYWIHHPDKGDHSVVWPIFQKSIAPLAGQSFHLLSIGAFALELARITGSPLVERSLTLKSGETSMTFGPGR